jgi:GNAT superfamily N-acetyltransferase
MGGLTPPRPLEETDNRNDFDCGRDSLNAWFRRHAWHNQAASVSRTSVAFDRESSRLAGFVSLSAAQIERAHLPKQSQRNRPDPIGAILLGQLAVDRNYHRLGYAKSLLLFAFSTSLRFAAHIGCFGVITHPLDDEVRNFYARFGFETLPYHPNRSMVVRIVDIERNLAAK